MGLLEKHVTRFINADLMVRRNKHLSEKVIFVRKDLEKLSDVIKAAGEMGVQVISQGRAGGDPRTTLWVLPWGTGGFHIRKQGGIDVT